MGMKRKPGLLHDIDDAGIRGWLDAVGAAKAGVRSDAVDPAYSAGRKTVMQMTDEDLAELSMRANPPKLVALAASELRRRESWRGPARWSLIISLIALAASVTSVAIAALGAAT